MNNQVGEGYIKAACEAVGVSRRVYYQAVKNRKNGAPLTKNQLDVLSELKRLVEDAKLKLQNL